MRLNIPMPPTPNSDLHLGHIAGPYLTADMANRCYKQLGFESLLISGLDSMEDWVSDLSRTELYDIYEKTQEDFSYLSIKFDKFILPNTHINAYSDLHRAAFDSLLEAKNTSLETESVFSNGSKWGFNSNIEGGCKSCGHRMVGYSCPYCFQVTEPSDLEQPRPTFDNGALKRVRNFFLSDSYEDFGPDAFCKEQKTVLEKNINNFAFKMRLTYQGDHGVSFDDRENTIIRNHFYFYCQFLCEVTQCGQPSNLNLFMGMDNFIPCGLSAHSLAKVLDGPASPQISIFTNHMLFYEGQKFSKSTGNGPTVISLRLADAEKVNASALRVYLASLNLKEDKVNFSSEEFQKFREKYSKILSRVAGATSITSETQSQSSEQVRRLLTDFLDRKEPRSTLATKYLDLINQLAELSREKTADLVMLMAVVDPELYARLKARPRCS